MDTPQTTAAGALDGPWVVEACVTDRIVLPDGAVTREAFHGWLWDRAPGLLGVDEGVVTAADAAARGFVPSDRVIDAAAAPADRDWVATLATATVTWWFADEAAARAAASMVSGLSGCEVRAIRRVPSDDLQAAARDAFGPISVAGFGVVRPAWETGRARVDADGTTIFIEPGLGFGTGLHETTQLCLAAVAEQARRGGRFDRVLDYGAGSGILGIAAAVLGATRVDAVEIDDRVHSAIAANARRNEVAGRLFIASVLPVDPAPWDVVVANIVAPVLVAHAADLCGRVHPGHGTIVLSGVLADEVPEVAACYAARLGRHPTIRERGAWRSLLFEGGHS